jgi:haloalkane dehalogenase
LRALSADEMAVYRAPFRSREARLPTLVWPRQIPIEGAPADVTAIAERYGHAMGQSALPKLLIVGDAGAITKGRTLEICRTWPNQTEVTVRGVHFLQEDSPDESGTAELLEIASRTGRGYDVKVRRSWTSVGAA